MATIEIFFLFWFRRCFPLATASSLPEMVLVLKKKQKKNNKK